MHKECTGTAYVEVASEQVQKMLMNSTRDVLKQSVHVSLTKYAMVGAFTKYFLLITPLRR